jgi:hypothetical protein
MKVSEGFNVIAETLCAVFAVSLITRKSLKRFLSVAR